VPAVLRKRAAIYRCRVAFIGFITSPYLTADTYRARQRQSSGFQARAERGRCANLWQVNSGAPQIAAMRFELAFRLFKSVIASAARPQIRDDFVASRRRPCAHHF
jgi:hypothetical protein